MYFSNLVYRFIIFRSNLQITMSLAFLNTITRSEDTAKQFLREMNVLRSQPPLCNICHTPMSNIKRGAGRSCIWRCRKHNSEKQGERVGSYWENCELSYVKILQLTYCWVNKEGVRSTMEKTGLASATVVDWYQFIRDICSNYLMQHAPPIGGPGRVVQIDKSVIAKRKYNRGRLIPSQWIFGGIDNTTKKGFLRMAPRRQAFNLLPIIEEMIFPGNFLYSRSRYQ